MWIVLFSLKKYKNQKLKMLSAAVMNTCIMLKVLQNDIAPEHFYKARAGI